MNDLFTRTGSRIGTKASWNREDVLTEIRQLRDKLTERLEKEGKLIYETSLVRNPVSELRKYDVVKMETFGTIHYILVYKVKDNKIFGVPLTTKERWAVHKITKDRVFSGFASKCFVEYDIEEAKPNFIRVYENKKEADIIFRKLKSYYKNLFRL